MSQSEYLSRDGGSFIKIFFFFRCFSHIFTVANQLLGFFISRLAYVDYFFNVNIFLNLNIDVSINDYSFKYI